MKPNELGLLILIFSPLLIASQKNDMMNNGRFLLKLKKMKIVYSFQKYLEQLLLIKKT